LTTLGLLVILLIYVKMV